MAAYPASILVLGDRSDRWFNAPEILAELLRVEGINDVEARVLEELDEHLLDGRSLVVLGPSDPSPRAADLLLEHAAQGGGLVCLAPGEALAVRLGLEPRFTGLMHPRIQVPLPGYPERGLPIRGWAQRYAPQAAAAVTGETALLDAAGEPTGFPAVLELARGKGRIAVLAWDAGACVFLLRQGNPLLAGCRSSGIARMRPADLFEGWQDPVDAGQPVADLHCHFFRELVHRVWPQDTVLPWVWYYPDQADTVLLLTSDDDGSTRQQFEQLIDTCLAEEARLTFYLVERSVVDRAWLEELAGLGFDLSIHPDLPPPTWALWEERLGAHVRGFRERYGRAPGLSVRNHAITWWGYVHGVDIQAWHGFRFDTNYFSLPPPARYYMCGAGLPMLLADPGGRLLPVYQVPTQFSDETTLVGPGYDFSLKLTPDEGIVLVDGLVRASAGGHHSLLCVNAHPVSFATYSAPLWQPVLHQARARGVPVWSPDRFGRFWEARRQVRLRPVPRGDLPRVLPQAAGMSAMVPVEEPVAGGAMRTVGGRRYAVCPLG